MIRNRYHKSLVSLMEELEFKKKLDNSDIEYLRIFANMVDESRVDEVKPMVEEFIFMRTEPKRKRWD